jgi:hypothetical protein
LIRPLRSKMGRAMTCVKLEFAPLLVGCVGFVDEPAVLKFTPGANSEVLNRLKHLRWEGADQGIKKLGPTRRPRCDGCRSILPRVPLHTTHARRSTHAPAAPHYTRPPLYTRPQGRRVVFSRRVRHSEQTLSPPAPSTGAETPGSAAVRVYVRSGSTVGSPSPDRGHSVRKFEGLD